MRWQAVRAYLPREETFELVDVGAGAGLLGEYLAAELPQARYRFVEPIDALEDLLEARWGPEANARGDDRYSAARFVCLLDVLEHQEDDRAFAMQLAAKIEPGSTLLITVPALNRLWSQWDEDLGHYRRYDRSRMERCMAGLPFRPLELSYLFPEMILPALARKRRRRGAGEPRAAEFPDLPRAVNAAALAVGSLTVRARRLWPAGTSLLAVYRRE